MLVLLLVLGLDDLFEIAIEAEAEDVNIGKNQRQGQQQRQQSGAATGYSGSRQREYSAIWTATTNRFGVGGSRERHSEPPTQILRSPGSLRMTN